MEIRRWLFCVVVNSALVLCVLAKPFSLNKVIEAESQQHQVQATVSPKLEASVPAAERFSLNKALKAIKSKKGKESGTILPLLTKKISPLKYKKTFQIKSPLKPKRVKPSLTTRHKRKNQSVKREISGNAKLNQKYIPLLRSLGMLFDNIIGTGSGESYEVKKRKHFKYYPDEDDETACKCSSQRDAHADIESDKKTIAFSEAVSTEISTTTEATTETAVNTAAGNVRSFRRNKNISLLLPRNTFGARRNNHRLSERSRATHNGSAEGNISGDHGDSEYNSEFRAYETGAESDEEYTDSDTRDDASSIRPRGGLRGNRENTKNNTKAIYENDTVSEDETKNSMGDFGRHVYELKREVKLEINGNETKSAKHLPESVRRLRGFQSEDQVVDTAESVQSEEDNEESNLSVAYNSSSDQRIFNRNGSPAAEDKKVSSRYEAVTKPENDGTVINNQIKSTKTSRSGPVVVIIDGYSVTRHKNGENKLAEKTIRIRPS